MKATYLSATNPFSSKMPAVKHVCVGNTAGVVGQFGYANVLWRSAGAVGRIVGFVVVNFALSPVIAVAWVSVWVQKLRARPAELGCRLDKVCEMTPEQRAWLSDMEDLIR